MQWGSVRNLHLHVCIHTSYRVCMLFGGDVADCLGLSCNLQYQDVAVESTNSYPIVRYKQLHPIPHTLLALNFMYSLTLATVLKLS